MGLAYTIDTPLRVAHYGIDSVISIVDDDLIEKMRAFFCNKFRLPYTAITAKMEDSRARRITAYLDMVDALVRQKLHAFCEELAGSTQAFESYLQMLSKGSATAQSLLAAAKNTPETMRGKLKDILRPGSVDVNIMTKVDKTNYSNNKALPAAYNDAHAALRGYAQSSLRSSLVLSAGLNPSLYSYIATFNDFLPDQHGAIVKKIILKVSDFRSAMVQGSFLAKKGVWVSEYRIESGLNCGGHAFATEGLLLGPILQEFRDRRSELVESAYGLLATALRTAGREVPMAPPPVRITAQGGVGTAEEHDFLLDFYQVDSVGWGTPFLLVPEATATDEATRTLLANAGEANLYRSDISPLGVPFNTVAGTTNDAHKERRIKASRPGSSCPKKLLALHNEMGVTNICTASHKYQQKKLALLAADTALSGAEAAQAAAAITAKACLCVGLANPAYIEKGIAVKGEEQGVVICPGPNMAYFNKEASLKDMVRHIYGYTSLLAEGYRPNMFIKELDLYCGYFKKAQESNNGINPKRLAAFRENLLAGIAYYERMFAGTNAFGSDKATIMKKLEELQSCLLPIPAL